MGKTKEKVHKNKKYATKKYNAIILKLIAIIYAWSMTVAMLFCLALFLANGEINILPSKFSEANGYVGGMAALGLAASTAIAYIINNMFFPKETRQEQIDYVRNQSYKNLFKIAKILEDAANPISAYWHFEDQKKVYVARNFFELIGENEVSMAEDGWIPANVFISKIEKIKKKAVAHRGDGNGDLYNVEIEEGNFKWIRITSYSEDNLSYGIVEDLSDEVLKRSKMEFERDYDILTSIYNRRAFYEQMQILFNNPQKLKKSAMISIDLDNLKKINDEYGHELGDEYIRIMANILKSNLPKNSVVSRFGGDEFCIFVHGFDTEKEIRLELAKLDQVLKNKTFAITPKETMTLSASGGIAWYPADSESYSQLIKYADFAMYSIKKTTKNGFAEFFREEYEKAIDVHSNLEAFDEFITNKMYEYTFQPIVDAKSGEIAAYEAFINSKHPMIRNTRQLFEQANTKLQMYQLENLTWNEALKSFEDLGVKPTTKLFINSIPEQLLNISDMNEIKRNYCHLLNQLVIEISNASSMNMEMTKAKEAFLKEWGGSVAIGDYGRNTCDYEVLSDIKPSYVKIDITLTQNISTDYNRRQLVEGLVSYAHKKQISVVAEGVENAEDMYSLIDIGVDYLQGYYIARPSVQPPKNLGILEAQIVNYTSKKNSGFPS